MPHKNNKSFCGDPDFLPHKNSKSFCVNPDYHNKNLGQCDCVFVSTQTQKTEDRLVVARYTYARQRRRFSL